MCRVGDHPLTSRLLERAAAIPLMKGVAARRGVPTEDIADVIQDACLAVHKLRILPKLQELIDACVNSPAPAQHVEDWVTATLVIYVKFACRTYRRKKAAEGRPVEPLPPSPVDDAMRRLIADLFPRDVCDAEGVLRGDPASIRHVCELLCERAGLSAQERAYVQFKAQEPGRADKLFDSTLRPYEISRIRKGAIGKITHFLQTGSADGRTEKR